MQADPKLFFHAMPYLLKRKAEEKERPKPDLALVNDIGTALRFVDEDFGDVTASHKSLVANGQITFDLIWTICPPDAIILAPKHGLVHQMQCLKLAESSYRQRPNQSWYFHIYGAIITCDGTDFGWGHLDLEIDKFDGAKEITGLAAFPLQYSHEREAVRERLVARGRKYLSIIDKPTCLEYAADGRTLTSGITETEIILLDGQRKIEKFNARKANPLSLRKNAANGELGSRPNHGGR